MSVLSGKNVLLGVSGGIAAQNGIISTTFYKAGAHVQVIMTPASKVFVPLTLSTLSKILFTLVLQ
jgi:phosphopantothenoylcysteine decarboxylase/phosphopantothenate--cysteine ligase